MALAIAEQTHPYALEHAQAAQEPHDVIQLVGMIAKLCIDPELLQRQQTQRVVSPNTHVTLATVHTDDGESRTTYIGNVDYIMSGVEIGAGAVIGDNARTCSGAILETCVTIQPDAEVGYDALVPHGTTVSTGEIFYSPQSALTDTTETTNPAQSIYL